MISYTPFIPVILILVGYSAGFSNTEKQKNGQPGNSSTFILGGGPAGPTEFNFMAVMTFNTKSEGQCCGVIIDAKWVLTSADCAANTDRVRAGLYNLTQDSGHEQNLPVAQWFIHQNWNPVTFDNNIGLIKMAVPFKLNAESGVGAIAIAGHEMTSPPLEATVASWGSDPILQKVTLQQMANGECQQRYNNIATPSITVSCTEMCYGGQDPSGSLCPGDWGAPLFDSTLTLFGIASFSNCGTSPTLFTNIPAYNFWITTTMADNNY